MHAKEVALLQPYKRSLVKTTTGTPMSTPRARSCCLCTVAWLKRSAWRWRGRYPCLPVLPVRARVYICMCFWFGIQSKATAPLRTRASLQKNPTNIRKCTLARRASRTTASRGTRAPSKTASVAAAAVLLLPAAQPQHGTYLQDLPIAPSPSHTHHHLPLLSSGIHAPPAKHWPHWHTEVVSYSLHSSART